MDIVSAKKVVDKHFRLLESQRLAYKAEDYAKAERLCKSDITLYEEFTRAYVFYEINYIYRGKPPAQGILLPGYPAFLILAKIYEKQGQFSKAIQVCDKAISLGVSDGTKGNFVGRKTKLEKKLTK